MENDLFLHLDSACHVKEQNFDLNSCSLKKDAFNLLVF